MPIHPADRPPVPVPNRGLTRRDVMRASLAALPAAVALGVLTATPECLDAEDVAATTSRTEGPYFKPRSPAKTTLIEPGMRGTRLHLAGRVLTTGGLPIAKAVLDLWQADADGAYDLRGFRLRGNVTADERGRYEIDTIIPGLYPGRTAHIHVRVAPPQGRVLTTQLFFPDQPQNRTDGLYQASLLVKISDGRERKEGAFDFVLAPRA